MNRKTQTRHIKILPKLKLNPELSSVGPEEWEWEEWEEYVVIQSNAKQIRKFSLF